MKGPEIIRAWKDPEYRATLTEAELTALPAHPSGQIVLTDSDLGGVAGAEEANTENIETWGCCKTLPSTFYMPCKTHYVILWSGCCGEADLA
jgi:mersacidin/lichenicidin family type 2 lantibiotic